MGREVTASGGTRWPVCFGRVGSLRSGAWPSSWLLGRARARGSLACYCSAVSPASLAFNQFCPSSPGHRAAQVATHSLSLSESFPARQPRAPCRTGCHAPNRSICLAPPSPWSAACCLTLRSKGRAPAWHLAREALQVIIRLAGPVPHRRAPLSSNVSRLQEHARGSPSASATPLFWLRAFSGASGWNPKTAEAVQAMSALLGLPVLRRAARQSWSANDYRHSSLKVRVRNSLMNRTASAGPAPKRSAIQPDLFRHRPDGPCRVALVHLRAE
jgi:hypothetical protein